MGVEVSEINRFSRRHSFIHEWGILPCRFPRFFQTFANGIFPFRRYFTPRLAVIHSFVHRTFFFLASIHKNKRGEKDEKTLMRGGKLVNRFNFGGRIAELPELHLALRVQAAFGKRDSNPAPTIRQLKQDWSRYTDEFGVYDLLKQHDTSYPRNIVAFSDFRTYIEESSYRNLKGECNAYTVLTLAKRKADDIIAKQKPNQPRFYVQQLPIRVLMPLIEAAGMAMAINGMKEIPLPENLDALVTVEDSEEEEETAAAAIAVDEAEDETPPVAAAAAAANASASADNKDDEDGDEEWNEEREERLKRKGEELIPDTDGEEEEEEEEEEDDEEEGYDDDEEDTELLFTDDEAMERELVDLVEEGEERERAAAKKKKKKAAQKDGKKGSKKAETSPPAAAKRAKRVKSKEIIDDAMSDDDDSEEEASATGKKRKAAAPSTQASKKAKRG